MSETQSSPQLEGYQFPPFFLLEARPPSHVAKAGLEFSILLYLSLPTSRSRPLHSDSGLGLSQQMNCSLSFVFTQQSFSRAVQNRSEKQ